MRAVIKAMALTLALSGALSAPASAQYFGSTRSSTDRFAFEVLPTSHFDIYYYPDEADGDAIAARMAERWYARLSDVLGHTLTERPPIMLYASHAHFTQTNIVSGAYSAKASAASPSHQRGRVVLPFAPPRRNRPRARPRAGPRLPARHAAAAGGGGHGAAAAVVH